MNNENIYIPNYISKIQLKHFSLLEKEKLFQFLSSLPKEEEDFKNFFSEMTEKEFLKNGILLLENLQKEINPNNISQIYYFLIDENINEIIGLYIIKKNNKKSEQNKEINQIDYIIKENFKNKEYDKIGFHLSIKEISKLLKENENEIYIKTKINNFEKYIIIISNNGKEYKRDSQNIYLKISKNNNQWIHKITLNEIDKVELILNDAKNLLKKGGTLQWQQGYPNKENFINDIKENSLYGIYENYNLMCFACFKIGIDNDYINIKNGHWEIKPNNFDLIIHRIAVSKNAHGKNLCVKILNYGILYGKKNHCVSVKVDTHEKNIPMIKCIEKVGFKFKGIVSMSTAPNDTLRNAYEYII